MSRRERAPHIGQPWAPRYMLGAHLAVLYEMRGRGEDHRTAPYLNAQDAWTGSPSCDCESCRKDRS
jgi:hypothetical protein